MYGGFDGDLQHYFAGGLGNAIDSVSGALGARVQRGRDAEGKEQALNQRNRELDATIAQLLAGYGGNTMGMNEQQPFAGLNLPTR